jgi:hypothetical protein
MGNFSWLAALRNNATGTRIRWELADPARLRGNYTLHDCWEHRDTPEGTWRNCNYGREERRFPRTLGELATELSDTKLFGYLGEEMIAAFNELSRILEPTCTHDRCFPRIYYEYEGWDEVCFLEFHPGEPRVNIGSLRITEQKRATYPLSPEDIPERDFDTNPVTTAEWDAYEEAHTAARNALMERVPELPGWRVKPLRHVPMSDTEALRALMARIYG